jgi:hypothetical protein
MLDRGCLVRRKNKMKIEIIADTHEPGSLETILWFLGMKHGVGKPRDYVYSTGDHIPSGMKGPEREYVDKLRGKKGVKNVGPFLAKRYEEDPEYREAVDVHNQKTIVNQNARKKVIYESGIKIRSCAGNQDWIVGKKIKDRYGGENILEDFGGTGLEFALAPTATSKGNTFMIMLPYDLAAKKEKRSYEELMREVRKELETDPKFTETPYKRVLILSHQSIDCTGMGLPDEARDAYTESLNRVIITAHYEAARDLVGPENVQLVHGHHHTPYMQYEFNGSRVHNLDIGDILSVDSETGETEVQHVFQRF